MVIKGEANAVKLELAKNIKKISDKVVIGQNKENNTTEIKIEDKSVNLHINFNISLSSPQKIVEIVGRVKNIFNEQAKVIESSGDKLFESYTPESEKPLTVGTSGTLVIQNRDYLIEGKGKPKFVKDFTNLPASITIVSPKDSSNNKT